VTTNRLRRQKVEWLIFVDLDENELHRVSTDGLKPEAILRNDSCVFFRVPGGRQLFSAVDIRKVGLLNVRVTLRPISDSEAMAKSLKKAKP
jgi:hypothetical protein